mgnify:CR=1 FL=1
MYGIFLDDNLLVTCKTLCEVRKLMDDLLKWRWNYPFSWRSLTEDEIKRCDPL